MRSHHKVIWTEGMFLQPQHFQQQDRYLARQAYLRLGMQSGYGWGFASLALDTAALGLGKIALHGALGVLPDGVIFELPGQDAAPPALDVPADVRNELVVLAAVLQRPGVPESDAESHDGAEAGAPAGNMPPRYRAEAVEVDDDNVAGERAAPIQVGRLNLRLMLARDAREGYGTLSLARVVERRADNTLVLDTDFVPPMLHAGSDALLSAWLGELHGLLHQRGEALAARLAQPGRSGSGEVVDFLLLQTVNRHEALFAQLRQATVLHPRELFLYCAALAGELASFRESRRPTRLPAWQHDDAARCFRPLMHDLRQSLSMVMEQTAIPIELQDRKYGIRVALLGDVQLQRSAQFVLVVAAQMPGDALRARFPAQVKIGPVERIRDLVSLQLPGIALRALPVAPRQIPFHAGRHYFELETGAEPLWRQMETSGGLAIHIAGDFPGLELEFWAVRS